VVGKGLLVGGERRPLSETGNGLDFLGRPERGRRVRACLRIYGRVARLEAGEKEFQDGRRNRRGILRQARRIDLLQDGGAVAQAREARAAPLGDHDIGGYGNPPAELAAHEVERIAVRTDFRVKVHHSRRQGRGPDTHSTPEITPSAKVPG
jgi:hypothetical protein